MEFSFWYKDDEMQTTLYDEYGNKRDNDLVKFMKPYSKVKFVACMVLSMSRHFWSNTKTKTSTN